MPKHRRKTEEGEEEREEEDDKEEVSEGSRQRSKTFLFSRLKSRLRRDRSSSVESPGDGLSMKAKCATLPARMKPASEASAPKLRTLYWMEQAIVLLDASPVSRKDSDESVDSGFHQIPKVEGSESDSYSPPQAKALVSLSEELPPPPPPHRHASHNSLPLPPPQAKVALDSPPPPPLHAHPSRDTPPTPHVLPFQDTPPSLNVLPSRDTPPPLPPHSHRHQAVSSMYDSAAVERAFGPMKDIGRWYSTYSTYQQVSSGRVHECHCQHINKGGG